VRTRLSVFVVLAGMTAPAAAHSPLPPNALFAIPPQRGLQPIDLPSTDTFLSRNAPLDEDDSLLLRKTPTRYQSEARAIPSIHIGAFHMELGGTSEKMHFAHYTLDGVRVMGGEISGSIDSRSARIMLRWPTGS
jgi:hypothetical protein